MKLSTVAPHVYHLRRCMGEDNRAQN